MLPGKKFTPEDIVQILRRRLWLILVPWAVIAAVTAGIARKLPDMYESKAWIQVTPPKVQTGANAAAPSLDRRLQAIQISILSRPRLERLIQEFNLYEAERKSQLMQEVVEKMRTQDIQVQPVKGDAFTVRYVGRNASTVMKVTDRLASYFKDENQKDGSDRATFSNAFAESQVDIAKRKLLEIEDKRTQYMLRHAGEMPTQLGGNIQAIQTINQNLNSIAQAIGAAQSNKVQLERLIAQAETQGDPGPAPSPAGADATGSTGTAAQRLAIAKANLSALQLRGLKPEHQDVIHWQGMVRSLTKEAEIEALQNPVGSGAGVSPAERARQAQLAAWREDLEKVKKEIDANRAEEKKQRAAAQIYQAKIDSVPIREAELVDLNRDYETLNQIYRGLVAQKEASSATVNLENRQMGEQFTLIEPARLADRPSSPDRILINLFGILGGLGVGLGLVALLEYRNTTFKTDTELASVLALPVLAVVPLMRSTTERRTEFRKGLFLNIGLGSTVFVCLAVLAYSFIVVK